MTARRIEVDVRAAINPKSEQEMLELQCSFCEKRKRDVAHLLLAPNGLHICNECITSFHTILQEVMAVH